MEILHRFSGNVIFKFECETIKECVLEGIKRNANLSNSNLYGADLCDADLSNANLWNANLRNANLSNANLSNANLCYANLYGANLCDADLSNANLWNANLRNANLYGANLCDANLWNEKITKTPTYINAGLNWQIWITDRKIKIGCQIHSTSFWEKASDDIISKMDNNALEFWNKWKNPILIMAKEHQRITEVK